MTTADDDDRAGLISELLVWPTDVWMKDDHLSDTIWASGRQKNVMIQANKR